MKNLSDTVWTSAAGQFTTVAKATAQFILPDFSKTRIVHTEIYATRQKLNDVKGAYLHADMTDFVVMKLTGEAVSILCHVNNKYKKIVTSKSGKEVLYVRLAKALYGYVKSALLWYELFTSVLKKYGFVLNPYDLVWQTARFRGNSVQLRGMLMTISSHTRTLGL